MARRSNPQETTNHLETLRTLLLKFEQELKSNELREKVISLVPVFYEIRDLGSSLISAEIANSAMDRILYYFKKYPLIIIHGEELMVISGIDEWARRVRQLRTENGWNIISGVTLQEMIKNDEVIEINGDLISHIRPNDYILLSSVQDREAAHRWNIANTIRKSNISVKDKLLKYFQQNEKNEISGEELRYVAKGRTEWARRVRELRTEEGWPIVTKNSGRPDLPVGIYVLEENRQLPVHDRKISDKVRISVLERDNHQCTNPKCKWNYSKRNPADPRQFLELHHIIYHVAGGVNEPENLLTLCNVCHDRIHAGQLIINW